MTVNNVNALLTYAAGRTDAAGNIAGEAAEGNFEQFMSKFNGKPDAAQPVQPEKAAGSSAVSQTVVPASPVRQSTGTDQTDVQDSGKAGQADSTVRKETGDAGSDVQADAGDTVSETVERSGEELVQDIADEMDMTAEEVEEAMALLGLTAVQLFDPDHLRQLLLMLSGNTDELAFLTDEALYGKMQDLLGIVDESLADLQKELGLSEEELDALLKELAAVQTETDAAEEMPVQEMPEVNLEGMKDYTVSVRKDGETVQVQVTVDDESGSKSVQESVTGAAKPEMPDGQKTQQRDASADSGREGNAGNPFLQMAQAPAETVEIPEAANVEYRSLQTEEIMNQIVEYMKINLKADTQTMELQLHPASLGTVNVQIMAKDGGLTAHFTTQNEAVRAVIETQLIQLKNQFEEQGIKVDAVEVTVANHAYGQQFSQGGEHAEQNQAKAGKGRRRINLDRLDGEENLEEMEESDRIAVEMMQANGNTVDYTA